MRPTWPAAGPGFILNRALVAVALGCVFAVFLGLAELMIRAGLSSSLDVALAVGAALGTGIAFQANFRRAVRIVDRLFMPRRYDVAVALDRIRQSLRDRPAVAIERMSDDVAQTLRLESAAVFSRTPDGGFVRRSSHGWPAGTAWHLLPGEPLVESLRSAGVLMSFGAGDFADVALPASGARPRIAVTVRKRGAVAGALFLGPDRSGGNLDADTVRGLAAVLAEVLVA